MPTVRETVRHETQKKTGTLKCKPEWKVASKIAVTRNA